MVTICPCCGAVAPQPTLFPHAPIKREIFEFIRKHPDCSNDAILDAIYQHDPNGGPCSNVVRVHISRMRKTLRANGLDIPLQHGFGSSYRIVKLEEPAQ